MATNNVQVEIVYNCKNHKRVYYICSPFQYLCALSSIYTLASTEVKSILVVLYTDCKRNNEQLANLIINDRKVWSAVYEIRMRNRSYGLFSFLKNIKYIYNVISVALRVGPSSTIYIGDPRVKVFQLLAIAAKHEQSFFLDDGLGTLEYSSCLGNKSKLSKVYTYISSSEIYRRPCFYSIFDIEEEIQQDGYEYKKCDMSKLSNSLKLKSDGHYFIGQKLTQLGITDCVTYRRHIENYIRNYIPENNRLIYVAHRGEDNIEFLRDIPKLDLLRLDVPIELYFYRSKLSPISVASFYSTALVTLSQFYGKDNSKFIYIDLRSEILDGRYRSNMGRAYSMIEKYKIERAEL